MADSYIEVDLGAFSEDDRRRADPRARARVSHWLSLGKTLSRAVAESVLKGSEPGTFIFRRGSQLGTYACTVMTRDGRIKNFRVLTEEGGHYGAIIAKDANFPGGAKSFNSLHALIADSDVRRVWGLKTMCDAYDADETVHFRSREETYPLSKTKRFPVPDKLVAWTVPFPGYQPVEFTESAVITGAAGDVDPPDFKAVRITPVWNAIDGHVDRTSFEGNYYVDTNFHRPLNPAGRTGMSGRGALKRWGPNHFAHPIVTRWKRDGVAQKVLCDGQPVLEMVAIRSPSTGQWQIPEGPCGMHELLSPAIAAEFGPAALESLPFPKDDIKVLTQQLQQLFSPHGGQDVFRGYVDDSRNTDNAWIETICMNFHDSDGSLFSHINLHPDSRGRELMWVTLEATLDLFSDHAEWVKQVVECLEAAY